MFLAEKKKERVRKPEEVWKLLTSNCCPMQCMKEFAFNDVVSSEKSFKEKTMEEQRNWILQFLLEHSQGSEGKGTICRQR